jgi:hypothetical protein
MCLIQIGSGSASLDTNIQDGFSNYIVSKNIKKKVLIVEANSIHINNLKKFYQKNTNVQIFNLAIIPDDIDLKTMEFFYCLEDFPNYQIFSNSKSFVKKHFPYGKIEKKSVECLKISKFFVKNDVKSDWMFTKNYKNKKLQTFFLPITPRRIWKRYKFSISK